MHYNKYEYLKGEEILPKFAYSPLGKAFEKQNKTKTIEEQGKKQAEPLKVLDSQKIKN